jgi:queuine tRNA-ribosyltransferase
MTPSSAIETQRIIGADIIMAFDQCTPDEDDRISVIKAMERTHRWLKECKNYHDQFPESHYGYPQALFGIIQGGSFLDLRKQCAEHVVELDLDGIALGGETIGFNMEKTGEILDYIIPQLPENKPRYTMGVGLHPQNLIDAVFHGADMVDCVAPTRNARHGTLYAGKIVRRGDWVRYENSEDDDKILIKKKIYQSDQRPLVEGCQCYTCLHHTRAYLHYLFKTKSVFYSQLACIHNIHVMHDVCEAMKRCIQDSC